MTLALGCIAAGFAFGFASCFVLCVYWSIWAMDPREEKR